MGLREKGGSSFENEPCPTSEEIQVQDHSFPYKASWWINFLTRDLSKLALLTAMLVGGKRKGDFITNV